MPTTTAKAGFDAGAGIMTHMFNAMNGLPSYEPGPIPAAVEDPRVTIELINDGFHAESHGGAFVPFRAASYRLCHRRHGRHRLPGWRIQTGADECIDGHARLVSQRRHCRLHIAGGGCASRSTSFGISAVDAVEAATLTPAKAFWF